MDAIGEPRNTRNTRKAGKTRLFFRVFRVFRGSFPPRLVLAMPGEDFGLRISDLQPMTLIHRICSVRLYFLPVQNRVPLKFGHETVTSVTCARVALRVVDSSGRHGRGLG